MRCEDFRACLIEFVDGELDASRTTEAREHSAACASCGADLDAAREDSRQASDSLKSLFEGIRPDPARKQSFVERAPLAARVRRPWAAPFAAAAAAALLAAAISLFAPRSPASPAPVPASADPATVYQEQLVRETERRFEALAARETGNDALDAILALDLAEQEISLFDGAATMPLEKAVRQASSKDLARRAEAKRVLAAAPVEALEKLAIEDRGTARFVRALIRTARNGSDPEPQGDPMISIQSSNRHGGKQVSITFQQFRNGVVHVAAREGDAPAATVTDVWAHDMVDLTTRHGEFCRRVGIVNDRGEPTVSGPVRLSTHSIVIGLGSVRREIGGDHPGRAREKLDALRMEAIACEATRSKGEVELAERIVRQVQEALRRSGVLDENLARLRDQVPRERRGAAEEWERAYSKARELEVYCDEFKKLDR